MCLDDLVQRHNLGLFEQYIPELHVILPHGDSVRHSLWCVAVRMFWRAANPLRPFGHPRYQTITVLAHHFLLGNSGSSLATCSR